MNYKDRIEPLREARAMKIVMSEAWLDKHAASTYKGAELDNWKARARAEEMRALLADRPALTNFQKRAMYEIVQHGRTAVSASFLGVQGGTMQALCEKYDMGLPLVVRVSQNPKDGVWLYRSIAYTL